MVERRSWAVGVLFVLFILLCGVTHLFAILHVRLGVWGGVLGGGGGVCIRRSIDRVGRTIRLGAGPAFSIPRPYHPNSIQSIRPHPQTHRLTGAHGGGVGGQVGHRRRLRGHLHHALLGHPRAFCVYYICRNVLLLLAAAAPAAPPDASIASQPRHT